MRLRLVVTMIVLFLYGVLFNLYIYELFRLSPNNASIMYNLITFGMLVFCVFDWKFGFVNDFHKQFNFLGFLSLMVNYLLIILTRTRVITDPVPMFFVFNSGLFLVTAMVFSSGIKHRIFD